MLSPHRGRFLTAAETILSLPGSSRGSPDDMRAPGGRSPGELPSGDLCVMEGSFQSPFPLPPSKTFCIRR